MAVLNTIWNSICTFWDSLDKKTIMAGVIITVGAAAILFTVAKFRTWFARRIQIICSAIKRRRQMSRENKMWKKYGIMSQIVDTDPTAVIEKKGDIYSINFQVTISFKALDDRNDSVVHEDLMANLKGNDSGREPGHFGRDYKLLCSERERLVIPKSIKSPIRKTYIFYREYNLKPSLKNDTVCTIQIGYADISSLLYKYRMTIKNVRVHVERSKDATS